MIAGVMAHVFYALLKYERADTAQIFVEWDKEIFADN